jgi:acyl-coenzyme A thioesterase PaaI-like protein
VSAPLSTAADRLADAVRELLDTSVGSTADDTALEAARDLVGQAVAALAQGRPTEAGPVHTMAFRHAHSLVTGTANAVAPPVRIVVEDEEVRGTFRLGKRHEGAPGLAHGGIVSLVLDHALGEAALAKGVGGMTVELDVRFLAPTRLDADLEVRARVTEVDGKKVRIGGTISQDGEPTATATALFIQLDPKKAAQLFPELTSER